MAAGAQLLHVKPTAICLEHWFPVIGATYIFYVTVLYIISFQTFKNLVNVS